MIKALFSFMTVIVGVFLAHIAAGYAITDQYIASTTMAILSVATFYNGYDGLRSIDWSAVKNRIILWTMHF